MQKNHMGVAHAENHPRNPVAVEAAAHFPKAIAKGSAVWTAKRPTKLDFLNVFSNRVSVSIP